MSESISLGGRAIPVAEIERRIHWRIVALVVFVAFMAMLATVAALSLLAPRHLPAGLPEDPDVRVAVHLVRGHIARGPGELVMVSEVLGTGAPVASLQKGDRLRLERAAVFLERARVRLPKDPRLATALADVEAALGRGNAERRYLAVLDRHPGYGTARLNLGVLLAQAADAAPRVADARALRLRSIAHVATVDRRDPVYDVALFDRVLLLDRVGRKAEARRVARAFLADGNTGAWPARIVQTVIER